jgi:hypothetical protein
MAFIPDLHGDKFNYFYKRRECFMMLKQWQSLLTVNSTFWTLASKKLWGHCHAQSKCVGCASFEANTAASNAFTGHNKGVYGAALRRLSIIHTNLMKDPLLQILPLATELRHCDIVGNSHRDQDTGLIGACAIIEALGACEKLESFS